MDNTPFAVPAFDIKPCCEDWAATSEVARNSLGLGCSMPIYLINTAREFRGLSRLRSHTVTIICDGMDQSKWDLPRSPYTKAKEFASMQKVRMHVAACICHGHSCVFYVSASDTRKDGSASVEMLAHMLTRLQRKGVPLSQTHLVLQRDNTCREFKNHCGLRFCASQVSSKNLASGECDLFFFKNRSHSRGYRPGFLKVRKTPSQSEDFAVARRRMQDHC